MNPVPLATDWEKCKRIAGHFRYQVHPEDGDDLVQGVLLEILERSRRSGGLSDKELWRLPGACGIDTGAPISETRGW